FFFQAEDGLRDATVTGVQTCALPISGCNRANPQAAGSQMPPPPLVSVAKAQAQDVPVYLDEIGKSYAFESVTVTPQVGGRITEKIGRASCRDRENVWTRRRAVQGNMT